MLIARARTLESIQGALLRAPVTVLYGPRQSGKTTLARQLVDVSSPNYFDLEDPTSLSRLEEPMTALQSLQGVVVIDEVQRRPDLFPILRVLTDRSENPARFLILGSASGALLRQSSESLAGRVERITISGFTLGELGVEQTDLLWHRGGFPPAYLADAEQDSLAWRREFILTLLERDLPQWGVGIPATALLRFWSMIAHYHAQTWNASGPARALGVNPATSQRYLDVLSDALMVRQLHPWFANLKKRQVKSPKIYIRDSGLLHQLLGIESEKTLLTHPKIGASWEGFVIEQILATEPHDEAYFWATHQGAEIDLILRRGDRLLGIECKRADAPRMTPSVRTALDELKLERVVIVYPHDRRYRLADRVEVVPLGTLAQPAGLFG
jgi:uncharacterized protein